MLTFTVITSGGQMCYLLSLGDIVETDANEKHASSPKVGGVEESWPPCIRLVTLSSEKLSQGEVFVVTKVGANIGRCVLHGNNATSSTLTHTHTHTHTTPHHTYTLHHTHTH